MGFKEQLQVLRKSKNISQEKLAEQLGISRQAVAKWESGQSYPDLARMMELAGFFKVSLDKLLDNDKEKCSLILERTGQTASENEMIEFLLRAKRATYAGKGAESQSSRPSSHDLVYSEGEFHYIDTYLGGECFSGEEGVWKNNSPSWSMNYVGRVLGEGFSGDFLKESLLNVTPAQPFRGPVMYQDGPHKYHCMVTGDFQWFQGYEEIYFQEEKVYECFFHGAAIR